MREIRRRTIVELPIPTVPEGARTRHWAQNAAEAHETVRWMSEMRYRPNDEEARALGNQRRRPLPK
jgi:hypothetical protein